MEAVISFFSTSVEDMVLNKLATIFNIGFIALSIAVLYLFILWNLSRHRGKQYTPSGAARGIAALTSVCTHFAVYGLYVWSTHAQNVQTSQNSWDHFCQLVLMLLDPVFGVSNLADSPIPKYNLTGPNFLFRVLCLCLLGIVIGKAAAFARNSEREFSSFLDERVFAAPKDGDKRENPGAEETVNTSRKPPRKKSTSGAEPAGSVTELLETLLKLLPGTGIVGSILAYILGGDDARTAIIEIIKALGNLMDTITLTSHILPGESGTAVFFLNFLYIILSICILAIYGVIIAAMITFVVAAWNNRDKIISWVTKKGSAIFLCVGVTCLILLACTIVFLTGSSFETLKDAFGSVFHSREVFDTVAQFILLILSICIVVLMLGFVIVFSFFIACLGIQIGKESRKKLNGAPNILFYAKILAAAVIGVGSLLGIGYGYQSISSGLLLLFPEEGADPSLSLLWVTGHFLLLMLVAAGALLAAATLVKGVFFALGWLWSSRPERMLTKILGPFQTLLQIFVGYSSESEKNRAIFLAAAFASLASMLNTFFGLIDFYNDKTNAIPIICSLAISGAVQLAMLIFGMKAGEGFAERYMLGTKSLARSSFWILAFKVCIIIVCGSALVITCAIVWGSLPWSGDNSSLLNIVLPVSFMLLSGTVFIFAIIRQCADIPALWRAWREERKARNEPGGNVHEERMALQKPPQGSKPRRLPPYFYLTAYLLLMLVSTGFAFNNLFGYYADQANLHEQVYDQVIDQAGQKLQLNQRIAKIVNRYDQNTRSFISVLETRVSTAMQKMKEDIAILDQNVTNQEVGYNKDRAQNLRDRYAGDTRDLSNVVEALKDYISRDASSIGDEAKITTYKYSHFWGGSSQPSYETTCIVIEVNGVEDVIGQRIDHEEINSVTITTDAGEQVPTLYKRYKDPDSALQSVAEISRPKSKVDKYDIIETLLDIFDSQEQVILSYDAWGTINGTETNDSTVSDHESAEKMRQLLAECDTLERVQKNLTEICTGEDDPPKTTPATIHDLPHIVVDYLSYDRAYDGDKLESYQKMSAYIDQMLEVYDILPIADFVLDDPAENEDPESPSLPNQAEELQTVTAEDESAYTVQVFRGYAQGIAHSNFQISYDALFRGNLGLNQYRSDIDTLYRSSTVAIFILLICLLVDMMAFFGGLLLFKEVFLFEKNRRLEQIGYLNYEALLTNMFTPPRGRPIRLLHLAVIYRLLYGDPDQNYETLPDSERDMEKLHSILNSKDFHALYDETMRLLRDLGIEDHNMPELQQWLMDFVQKNGIDFDDPSL